MLSSQSPTVRDDRGRFAPGCSGNPAGKAPGTLNHATRLKALLRDGEAEAAGREIIARAVAGDPVAGRFLFDRLDPKPRGRPILLDGGAGSLAERFAAIFAAAADGVITPDEALALGRLLAFEGKALGAAAPTPDTVAPPLDAEADADARQAAVLAELAAVFGAPAVASELPALASPDLHSTCISRPTAPPPDTPPPDIPFARRRSQARPPPS